MISPTMQDALNAQINSEQYSAQLYLAMSAHCATKSFKGFAHWLRIQASEETAHAPKLIQNLLDRAGRLQLRPIPAPPAEFGTVIEVFEKTLEHEKAVTAKISALFDLARKEGDYASEITLQWYVTEQVEEEKTAASLLETLRMAGDNKVALLMLDRELGARQAGA